MNSLMLSSKFGKRKTEHKSNKKIFSLHKNQLFLNSTASGDMKMKKFKKKLFHHFFKKKIWIKSYQKQTGALNKFQTIYSLTEKLNYSI
jgi:hypothetical protein